MCRQREPQRDICGVSLRPHIPVPHHVLFIFTSPTASELVPWGETTQPSPSLFLLVLHLWEKKRGYKGYPSAGRLHLGNEWHPSIKHPWCRNHQLNITSSGAAGNLRCGVFLLWVFPSVLFSNWGIIMDPYKGIKIKDVKGSHGRSLCSRRVFERDV